MSVEGDLDLRCRTVVNCAGLGAVGLARRMEGSDPASLPEPLFAKGNYFRYAGECRPLSVLNFTGEEGVRWGMPVPIVAICGAVAAAAAVCLHCPLCACCLLHLIIINCFRRSTPPSPGGAWHAVADTLLLTIKPEKSLPFISCLT